MKLFQKYYLFTCKTEGPGSCDYKQVFHLYYLKVAWDVGKSVFCRTVHHIAESLVHLISVALCVRVRVYVSWVGM